MIANDDSSRRCLAKRPHADAQEAGCLGEIHPSVQSATLWTVAGDGMLASQRRNTHLGPSIAPSGAQAVAIEHPSDVLVTTNARELTHRHHGVFRRVLVVLSASSPRQAQFGVHAAPPVNDQNNL